MFNQKQIFILLIVISFFCLINYFSREYKVSINNAFDNWKEQAINTDKENEEVTTTILRVGNNEIDRETKEIEITETDKKRLEIINNYDNYSFILPEDWKEVISISYFEKQLIEQYIINTTIITGGSLDRQISISKYDNKTPEGTTVKDWISQMFQDVYMTEASVLDFDINDNIDAVIRKDNSWVYFQNDFTVYAINYPNKEIIKEIILNGEW